MAIGSGMDRVFFVGGVLALLMVGLSGCASAPTSTQSPASAAQPVQPVAPKQQGPSPKTSPAVAPPVAHETMIPPKAPVAHFHKKAALKPEAMGGGAGAVDSSVAASPPPPPPPPAEDDETLLNNALAHLQPGNLAYSTPQQMKMETMAHIVAKIATDAVSAAALTAAMPGDAGTKTVTEATSITPKMKMTLTSADFDITALSSEEQIVAGTVPTTWEWDIVPKHSGELSLHLAAVIELDGSTKDFATVNRQIEVNVDPADAVGDFVKGNWQWLIATLTAIVGAGWKYFSGRKKAAGSTAA